MINKLSKRCCQTTTNHNSTQILVSLIVALVVAGCAPASADSDSAEVYVVQAGDTLARIATANDTTVAKLVELNKDTYPSLETDPGAIEVGWELELPGSGRSKISIPVTITVKKTPSGKLPTPDTPLDLDQDAFEAEIVRLVNEERVKVGLAPLETDQRLMEFARKRSEDMAARGYRGHQDPETGETLYETTLRSRGYGGLIAENIAYPLKRFGIQEAPNQAVSDWMGSDGHRENILESRFHKVGIGVALGAKYFVVTLLFAE